MSSEQSRREFLESAGRWSCGVFLVGLASSLPGCRHAGDEGGPTVHGFLADGSYDPTDHAYAMLVDVRKCIGCGSCVRACAAENDVPPGHFRTWIERYTVYANGDVKIDSPNGGYDGFDREDGEDEVRKAFFVPKLCNHCAATPCVQLCPVAASYISPDGVVLVDEDRCIGCGYCIQACPYGSRFMHPERHIASKCTFCYHRVTRGLRPACVEACPTGARMFGDLKDPDDEVARILVTEEVHVLKPELLTKPVTKYLGLSMEVR
ncbi:MAG: 4Fe-4S dicluster domain-containing protein [Armatimonadetes bacterium]|nr:4Fe-4S dicluster domain-containing protein [Armatimonadota bacterium]